MLEKEYKSLLTEEEYKTLEAAFEWDSVKKQENHYFTDENGILRANRVMFRVRVKDGKNVIQVKTHQNGGSPLQICEELEFETDGVPDVIENGEKYTGIKTAELHNIGCAVTLRHSKMWDADTEICLDKTEYLGVCDYEIEIEYTSEEIDAELTEKLKSMGIEFKAVSVGKFSRFLSVYNGLRAARNRE